MEAVVGPIVTACEGHLREPELRLARTCARILETLAGASGTLHPARPRDQANALGQA